jgi:hypothetical protein
MLFSEKSQVPSHRVKAQVQLGKKMRKIYRERTGGARASNSAACQALSKLVLNTMKT